MIIVLLHSSYDRDTSRKALPFSDLIKSCDSFITLALVHSQAEEVVAYVQDDDEIVRFGSLDSTQCFLCAGKICSLPKLW